MTQEIDDTSNRLDDNAPPSLTIDWDLYGSYLEDSDMSDEQKREFIQTLWNIIVNFIDLGFGVHPIQQAKQISSGQDDDLASLLQQSVVSSKNNSKINKYEQAVNGSQSYSAEQEES